MLQDNNAARLAAVLADARRTGTAAAVASDLIPVDEDAADRVQLLPATRSEPIAGYKVARVGDAPGSFGAIFAEDLFRNAAVVATNRNDLKVEVEIAFQLARDLPGRPDGLDYVRTDIEAAVEGALPAVEIVGGRLSADPKPAPLLARADRLGNFGLVVGDLIADWRPFAQATDYAASLSIGGVPVVAGTRAHPSGVDPLHPLVWLANRLVRLGGGLKAGDVITTGAFGGSHAVGSETRIEAAVGGLGTLALTIADISSRRVVA